MFERVTDVLQTTGYSVFSVVDQFASSTADAATTNALTTNALTTNALTTNPTSTQFSIPNPHSTP